MTSGRRIMTVVLALWQLVAWTCPAYCERSGERAETITAEAQAAASGHEHHHAAPGNAATAVSTIRAIGAECCGDCGPQVLAQAVVQPQSSVGKVAPSAVVVPRPADIAQSSSSAALDRPALGSSPPGKAPLPLRI